MPEMLANGVRLHVQRLMPRRRPRTPTQPIVFIHGLAMDNMSSYYYTLANPIVQAGAEVILYDLRGHGVSERPSAGYRVNDSVADLAALLDGLGIDGPVHLVGNSYGGTVALSMAATYPHRVASMVVIEANSGIAGWAEWIEIEIERRKADEDRIPQHLLAQLGRKVARLEKATNELLTETTFLADLKAMRPIPTAQLRSITCPVRAIYGEHSHAVHYAHHHLVKVLSRCVLTVLPGCGHSVLMDATAALRDIVLDWFATQALLTPDEAGSSG
jgi:pimeloyl-ACP methyl ester carboxylesterase